MTNFAPYRKHFAGALGRVVPAALALAALLAGCSSDDGAKASPDVGGAGTSPSADSPSENGAGAPAVKAPPSASLSEPEMRDLQLQVLMPGGEPAPHVPVRFIDTASIPPASLLRATGGEPDAEKILEVLGEEKLTDANGRATFQTSGGPLLASASLDRLFVMQPFAPAPMDMGKGEPLTLTLALDSSVRARAVDQDGSALTGIPIALSLELGTQGADRASRWIDLAVRETGGDDATVRFRDPRGGVQPAAGKAAPRFGLRPAIPGLEDATPVLFDPDAPPDDPIDLVVPPLSTFVVEVFSATGQLLDLEADVVVQEHRQRGTKESPVGSKLRARLEDGRATLGAVVPGTLLHVTVQPLDGSAAFEGVGPSALQAGDVATISVSIDR